MKEKINLRVLVQQASKLWTPNTANNIRSSDRPIGNEICHGGEDDAGTSVRLDIVVPYKSLRDRGGALSDKRASPFEPQIVEPISDVRDSTSRSNSARYPFADTPRSAPEPPNTQSHKAAPEKKITLFALRLAVLEKAASGLGTLGFIWATVVLLGGFAITLEKTDFWFVTIILLIEGTRIFSRSHELEWQHEATWSVAAVRNDAKRVSFRLYKSGTGFLKKIFCAPFSICRRKSNKSSDANPPVARNLSGTRIPRSYSHNLLKRTWSSSKVPLLPYTGWLFRSENVSSLLFWLQLLSALTCVVLSLYRLAKQDYGEVNPTDSETKNRNSALNIFYGLSLGEALLFLLEKAYWQWKINVQKLLAEATRECGFDAEYGIHTIRRFFYDAYSGCLNGSVFDGLRMDLVSFSVDLLQSNLSHGQLTGARVLSQFVKHNRFAEDTLRKIGTMQDVVERLIEMLNWKNPHEEEIRKAAAEIISRLVRKNRNSVRVAGIAGSLESITALLSDGKPLNNIIESAETGDTAKGDGHHMILADSYDYPTFNLLGLQILKNLAKDHDNCGKIGSTRGLLPKIVGFAETGNLFSRNSNAAELQIKKVTRALRLLKILAGTTGLTGKVLRKEISEIVYTISNLRDILQKAESRPVLQKLALDILTSLALEEDARESIGTTGGVLRILFTIFFRKNGDGVVDLSKTKLAPQAGEALALLSLESEHNCQRMIKLKILDRSSHTVANLIAVLNDPVRGIHAARILRNLCAYAGNEYAELRDVATAASQIVKLVTEKQDKYKEAAIGLAAQTFKFMDKAEFDRVFEEEGLSKIALAKQLVEVLKGCPSNKVPRIRRFSVEVVICMLQKDPQCFSAAEIDLEESLEQVIETTSDLESYGTFSGSVGLTKYALSIHCLVFSAMELLRR